MLWGNAVTERERERTNGHVRHYCDFNSTQDTGNKDPNRRQRGEKEKGDAEAMEKLVWREERWWR